MDESEEAGSELIETGGDPSELLELEEEGFHKMALLVKPPIDVLNLSSSVQSRNTQRSERQQRFPEPEVVILIRTAPRQPPRSGCLGRLSGKCYTGKSTGLVEACLIPIAVGGSSTAFSRRSVKTGGNRNVSPDFGSCVS